MYDGEWNEHPSGVIINPRRVEDRDILTGGPIADAKLLEWFVLRKSDYPMSDEDSLDWPGYWAQLPLHQLKYTFYEDIPGVNLSELDWATDDEGGDSSEEEADEDSDDGDSDDSDDRAFQSLERYGLSQIVGADGIQRMRDNAALAKKQAAAKKEKHDKRMRNAGYRVYRG